MKLTSLLFWAGLALGVYWFGWWCLVPCILCATTITKDGKVI